MSKLSMSEELRKIMMATRQTFISSMRKACDDLQALRAEKAEAKGKVTELLGENAKLNAKLAGVEAKVAELMEENAKLSAKLTDEKSRKAQENAELEEQKKQAELEAHKKAALQNRREVKEVRAVAKLRTIKMREENAKQKIKDQLDTLGNEKERLRAEALLRAKFLLDELE
jgi:hypothetical protein